MALTPLTRRLTVATAAAALLVSACGTDNTADTLAATYESIGNPDADIVVVNTQGGPIPELAIDELSDVGAVLDLDDVFVVTVHQAQTIDPDRFTEPDISFEEAKAADAESVAMLAEVVDHFVDEGRSVYVLGVSFGAFVTQELLATQGNIADGYLIMVGRLDMPDAVWTEFAEGRAAGFVNGTDVVEVAIEDAGMGAPTLAGDRNMARLAAGLGHTRYTETLAGADLSNVIYSYGDADEQVGRLTQTEIDFLTAAGATVWRSEKGHGGAIDDHLSDGLGRLLGEAPFDGISVMAPEQMVEFGLVT